MVIFSYQITNTEVQVRIGSWIVRRLSMEDIEYVREGTSLVSEHWTNFGLFRFVTIRRKTGILKNFVINPRDRTQFISALNQKLEKTITKAT